MRRKKIMFYLTGHHMTAKKVGFYQLTFATITPRDQETKKTSISR